MGSSRKKLGPEAGLGLCKLLNNILELGVYPKSEEVPLNDFKQMSN